MGPWSRYAFDMKAGNQCREARCRVGLEPLFVGLLVVLVRHPLPAREAEHFVRYLC